MSYKMSRCAISVALLVIASFTNTSFGQAVSGNIIGTVTDPSGSAIGGAEITIVNVGTSVSSQTTTNESGNFTAANLAAGNYTVTITKPGFWK
jgi:hypothetical protein